MNFDNRLGLVSISLMYLLKQRPRRLRKNPIVRDLVVETTWPGVEQLIYPVFIMDGSQKHIEIKSMPGQYRLTIDLLLQKISTWNKLGLKNFALFPQIDDRLKNSKASEAINPNGFAIQAIKKIKDRFPDIQLFTDVALDPFSSDGHDGLVINNEVNNDSTVELLSEMAVLQARAGADFVCPSDMMDGRIRKIRQALEQNGFHSTGIVAYSAKYASSFYGPFREALDSAPKKGDKKSYQMDFRNRKEALYEAHLDISEGADIIMVKPALTYLDVIRDLSRKSIRPIAAYNVSGEYAMVKAAAANNWINESKIILEILTSIKRAGAGIIFTYHAPDYIKLRDEL